MSDYSNSKRFKRNLALLIIPAVLSAALVFQLWSAHPDPEYWRGVVQGLILFLEQNPSALILSLAILPGIGVPISPILILFGAVLGPRYGLFVTCLIGALAQAVCATWTYYLSAGPLRGLLQRTILRRRPLPTLTEQNAWRIGLILRITPGIPYALQNVALGVMGLPFRIYMAVSIPIQSVYASAFIIGGGAIFNGRFGLALTAGIILVAVVLATRMYQSRNRTSC